MPLNTESKDRSYLFGRLLAVADVLERRALSIDKGDDRQTNAMRYMNSFAMNPSRTWKTIRESLYPYQARLGVKALKLLELIDDITNQFDMDDFNDTPLTDKYLLGFSSQRIELRYKPKKEEDTNE
ncbi:CRISPR-associated protein [compost metagenome]